MDDTPRWRRRKAARPGEIEAAALDVFLRRGFAAARLEDIAAQAGVSKAALYVYFPTKLDLFRAVVGAHAAPNIDAMGDIIRASEAPFLELMTALLLRMAAAMEQAPLRALARMVIAEGQNFPEVAALWHERLVSKALDLVSEVIARAQGRGEARSGDPRLMAFSAVGPMLLSTIWKEVMEPVGGAPVDLRAMALEHARTLATGLAATGPSPRIEEQT